MGREGGGGEEGGGGGGGGRGEGEKRIEWGETEEVSMVD